MPVYVVGMGSVLVMRVIRVIGMTGGLVMIGFVVVMRQRHPSIVVMMDVRIISSTMAVENRAHDTERRLLLCTASAKCGLSIQRPRRKLCGLRLDT